MNSGEFLKKMSTVFSRPRTHLMERILRNKQKGAINMENTYLTPEDQQSARVILGQQPDGSYAFECRWCHRIEVLSPDEVKWYLDRGFAMPTRCAPCRRKRRGIHRHYSLLKENT